MDNFPRNTDSLFIPNKTFSDVKIDTGINKFFYFSESYRIAAEKLFDKIKNPDYENHFLIAPAIYLCRHYIELRLKELISGINYTKDEKYSFPDGHNLENLWNTYKSALVDADPSIVPNSNDLKNIERLIKEFNNIDSSSMSFRYPVEKDKTTDTLSNLNSFDMNNFMTVMERIFNFFYEQSGNLFHLIELSQGYFSYLRNQMITEYTKH